ncbi:MAG: DUF2141 domain-containing protein [Erythrobacter sp.]|jgi:uncharacterized protein (DUF2141 family)|nr:DUF2141 domain-containing protein [Erythrobacter sp.]
MAWIVDISKRRGLALVATAALALGAGSAALAQGGYARVSGNDMSACAPGAGPAMRLEISGLRSGQGNLFVRLYKASERDWLKSKRYLLRIDERPRAGAMAVCVPVPAAGRYAIAVQHDVNGNRETDFSTDGAGMSNNPEIGSFLGIPRPPSVEKAAFGAGSGITRIAVKMRYRN